MTDFVNREICHTTTEGGRYSKELAEEIQFYHDISFWFKNNPIDPELEVQPSPERATRWIHSHRKTLKMIIERMSDATPI